MSYYQVPLNSPGRVGLHGRPSPSPIPVDTIEIPQTEYQHSFAHSTTSARSNPGFIVPQHQDHNALRNTNSLPVGGTGDNQQPGVHHSPPPPQIGFNLGPPPPPLGPKPNSQVPVTQHLETMRLSFITSAITTQLGRKLLEQDKFTAVFIPDKNASLPWQVSPTEFHWEWDNFKCVKLPLSSHWRKQILENGTNISVPRWKIIDHELRRLKDSCQSDGTSSSRIKECIKAYHGELAGDCNFKILNDPELSHQLIRVLPAIIDYCLELPDRLGKPIPFLKKGQWHTLFLSRGLCASLLANAFLSTIPHDVRDPTEFPHFHFLRLFHEGPEGLLRAKIKAEKIKCILEYFEQMKNANKSEQDSIISFERRCIYSRGNWKDSRKRLCFINLSNTETIEDARGLLQADFANKFVGGGVLSEGMVQEEIRFAICPELIVARLFTEVLSDEEVLVVTGAKQFSAYSGYRSSFEFKKMQNPQQLDKDEFGRELVQVVAMDALNFKPGSEWTQYQQKTIDRELHKCFVAFYPEEGKQHQSVATGNWGCGAFNGDPQLKFVIQWIAASEVGRAGMVFYTVGNNQQFEEINSFCRYLAQREVTVGQLYKILGWYENDGNLRGKNRIPVFEFIKKCLLK